MKKITTKTEKGITKYFIDGVEVSGYQYQKAYANNNGFTSVNAWFKSMGWKKLITPEQTFRIKEHYDSLPEDAQPIPGWPTYYATPDAQIWRWSSKRQCYLNISQQTQASGYNVAQLYDIDNKRRVKYVHRLVHDTFYGPCPEGYEVHHIDNNNTNNHANNLVCMVADEHRRMTRKPYKPRKKY